MMPDNYVSSMVRNIAIAMCSTHLIDPEALVAVNPPQVINGLSTPFWIIPNSDNQMKAWHLFVGDAEAAVTALLEPSVDMLLTAKPIVDQDGTHRQWWEAMLRAALRRPGPAVS